MSLRKTNSKAATQSSSISLQKKMSKKQMLTKKLSYSCLFCCLRKQTGALKSRFFLSSVFQVCKKSGVTSVASSTLRKDRKLALYALLRTNHSLRI